MWSWKFEKSEQRKFLSRVKYWVFWTYFENTRLGLWDFLKWNCLRVSRGEINHVTWSRSWNFTFAHGCIQRINIIKHTVTPIITPLLYYLFCWHTSCQIHTCITVLTHFKLRFLDVDDICNFIFELVYVDDEFEILLTDYWYTSSNHILKSLQHNDCETFFVSSTPFSIITLRANFCQQHVNIYRQALEKISWRSQKTPIRVKLQFINSWKFSIEHNKMIEHVRLQPSFTLFSNIFLCLNSVWYLNFWN